MDLVNEFYKSPRVNIYQDSVAVVQQFQSDYRAAAYV